MLGSSTSVSDAVYTQVAGTERLGGANRQETATKIADDVIANDNFDSQSVALVGGTDATAADALVGGPGRRVRAGCRWSSSVSTAGSGDSTSAYLMAKKANYTTAGTGWIFGGESAVKQATVDAATAAVQ